MNKFDRTISILILLQSKKILKASNISDRFGISLRTVYRDISTLKNAGIPICGDPGVGYSIMEGYRLPPIMFNEGETMALLTAEKFISKVVDKETYSHFITAMTKIKAVLRSTEKQSLEILNESISISGSPIEEHKSYLQAIFKSIANKYCIRIYYKKLDGSESTRIIEPIGSYNHHNKWYLVAYCQEKKDYRTFKINRIEQLVVLDSNFDQDHISLQAYLEKQKSNWLEAQEFQTMEIFFEQSVLQFAENRKYYFGFIEQESIKNGATIKFWNSSIEIMARWLLQFGNKATVITPQSLKDRLHTLSLELFEHYSK